jgi:WD40 repeat protein
VNRRLLTGDRDRTTREPTVEVAHEVLLRSWPRLQGWLADDRAWLREMRGLSSATASWIGSGCDEADLLRGARLAVVAELAAGHPNALTEAEQRFLDQSRDQADAQAREAERRFQHEARQNRRLRRSLIGLAAVLVAALTAGAVAVVQRRDADQQRAVADQERTAADEQRTVAVDSQAAAQQSAGEAAAAERASKLRTLAGDSLGARSTQRDLAALLAIEAWKGAPDASSKSALFGTFTFDPGFMGFLRFDGAGGVNGMAIPGTSTMLVRTFPRDSFVEGPPAIVDVVSGAIVRRLDPVDATPVIDQMLAVSPSGRFAAVRVQAQPGGSSVAAVFDLSTGRAIGQRIPLAGFRNSMALDASGTRLAVSADESGGVTVYDTATGTVAATMPGMPDAEPAEDVDTSAGPPAYGPDGRLYIGSSGGHLRVFDPSTFAQVDDIAVPDRSTDGLMRFGDDGTTLLVRTVHLGEGQNQVGSLMRVDLATGTMVWQVKDQEYGFGECDSFAFSVAAGTLWCGDYFGRIRERALGSGSRTGKVLQSQKGWATDLDVVAVPGGTELVATSNNDGVISRWRVDGGGPIQRLVASGKYIIGLLPDGVTAVVGTSTGNGAPKDPTLWDLRSDTPITGLPAMALPQVAGSSVFGVFADDQKVGRWDVATRQRTEFPIGPSGVSASGGSADGSTILLGYQDGHVDGYDASTGAAVLHVQLPLEPDGFQPHVTGVSVSMDRRNVFVVGDGLMEFDGTTGQVIATNPDRAIGHVQVGVTGVVVVTSVDGTMGVYDPATLARVATLPGARGYIQYLSLSSDDTLLVAPGNDGSVSVYDLAQRTRLGDPIDKVSGFRTPIALRPDGAVLAVETGDTADTGVALWDLDPAAWVDAACAIAGRNLTHEEWATYVGDLAPYTATCPSFPLPAA